MERRWCDAQTLGATRHGRIIDRLHIDAVITEQHIADLLAQDGISDHQRDDVARIYLMGQSSRIQSPAKQSDDRLVFLALAMTCFQMPDARKRGGSNRWRQRACEDEA